VFLESELMYSVKGEVPDEEYLIPIGKADIKRPGKDVTVITWGQGVPVSLKRSAELAAAEGIDVEVIDLRTLRPLDTEAVLTSVRKTNRAVVLFHGWPYGGVGCEVIARSRSWPSMTSTRPCCASATRTCRCRTPRTSRTWCCRPPRRGSRRSSAVPTGADPLAAALRFGPFLNKDEERSWQPWSSSRGSATRWKRA
jgi:hypothetical protein